MKQVPLFETLLASKTSSTMPYFMALQACLSILISWYVFSSYRAAQ
jgi:hypothetical protein